MVSPDHQPKIPPFGRDKDFSSSVEMTRVTQKRTLFLFNQYFKNISSLRIAIAYLIQ